MSLTRRRPAPAAVIVFQDAHLRWKRPTEFFWRDFQSWQCETSVAAAAMPPGLMERGDQAQRHPIVSRRSFRPWWVGRYALAERNGLAQSQRDTTQRQHCA